MPLTLGVWTLLCVIICLLTIFTYKICCCFHCIFSNKLFLIWATIFINPALKVILSNFFVYLNVCFHQVLSLSLFHLSFFTLFLFSLHLTDCGLKQRDLALFFKRGGQSMVKLQKRKKNILASPIDQMTLLFFLFLASDDCFYFRICDNLCWKKIVQKKYCKRLCDFVILGGNILLFSGTLLQCVSLIWASLICLWWSDLKLEPIFTTAQRSLKMMLAIKMVKKD